MITKLTLHNFKAFSRLSSLRISPLTLLSGKNSCGKSSILHSLLLLKQTIESDYPEEALLIDGKYIQYSHIREISFGLPVEPSASLAYEIELSSEKGKMGDISFEFRYKKKDENSHKKSIVVNKFMWQKEGNKAHSLRLVKGKYIPPKKMKLNWPEMPKEWKLTGEPKINFEHFIPKYIEHECEVPQRKVKDSVYENSKLELPLDYANRDFGGLAHNLINELKKLQYLGPSRAVPRRAYIHYAESNYDLYEDGSNAAHVFWLKRNEVVKWRSKKVNLVEAVNDCLKIMGLEQKVHPKQSSRIVYQLEVGIPSDNKKKVTIADVGFGYSQVLPIILRGLLAPVNSLVILEQPEIHLHPSSCANLADLFIEFIRNGRRILVETHSSELINRLRLRAVESPEIAEKVNIAFISPPERNSSSGAELKQLNLKADGMLDEWPDGFCDESEKLARAIMEARINRSVSDG